KENVPEAVHTVVNLGASTFRPGGASTGNVQVAVGPARSRERSSEQIANDLRKVLVGIPGVEIRTRESQGLRVLRMGQGQGNEIDIEIYGYDINVLDELSTLIEKRMKEIPGVTEVDVSREA